jgi:alkylation response protein AidB-like acyl-CoA dehydrogenase
MPIEHRKKESPARITGQAIRLAAEDLRAGGELGSREAPGEIWKKMARRGLLGWSIPASHGGGGARFTDILPAAESFVCKGGRPGLALSWMVHLIVGKVLISDAGNRVQKKEILPVMATGRVTASIALSEPGSGSDPKRIRTRAVKKADHYVLDGEKAWLTNGPLADLFIVFAVTGERDGRKQLTAFLIPRKAPGLTIREMPPLGYLQPSPHCAISMEGCVVPESAVLGCSGRAWEELSKPFRVVEDALLAGVILGGLDRQLGKIVRDLQDSNRDVGNDIRERIGAVAVQLDVARQIASAAAKDLDRGKQGMDMEHNLVALHLIADTLQESIDSVAEGVGIVKSPGTLKDDITRLIALGMHASRARQRKRADTLLAGKETS